MARKARFEVEGGLYHVINRGNDRQAIFHCDDDFQKFIGLIGSQKAKVPFFLYAYCLMTNHIHLLIERQGETLGRVMQRILTGYSQWYNRRYKHVGHVFQGRYKSILCDSDRYLSELVTYIHLNPVRARMVPVPEEYPYSSHREYLGLVPQSVTDIEPLLRRFAPTREIAIERFKAHVAAGACISYPESLDSPAERGVDALKDFADEDIHHIGEAADVPVQRRKRRGSTFDGNALMSGVEAVLGLRADQFVGADKNARSGMAKAVFILIGLERGATVTELAKVLKVDSSNVGRRADSAREKLASDSKLRYAKELVEAHYAERLRESHV